MAIWTSSDLAALKAAIASGVLMVSYDGPPKRTIQYQSLEAMRALLAQMIRDVNGTPSYRRVAFRKGFDDV